MYACGCITAVLDYITMKDKNTHIVIMAGGVGSRLWPISTPECPKQFIDVLGVGKSLIQMTVERFLPSADIGNFWVVTSADYASMVKEQLPDIPSEHILLEPEARNTAPCIAYACRKIAAHHPDANVVVTPSDALVTKTDTFTSVIGKALALTADSSAIVTIGIVPTRPETGYGYINAPGFVHGQLIKVRQFKEKPDLATAEKYLASGDFVWNAGIFVWNVRTINDELRAHAPQIMSVMDRLEPYFYTPGEQTALAKFFPTCDKISIDYAVMEKSPNIYVIAEDLGWSDLGSWHSLRAQLADMGLTQQIARWEAVIASAGAKKC